MLSYAVRLVTRYDGLVIATFPDLPGVSALGRDDEEARDEARRVLADALAALDAQGVSPPEPRAQGVVRVTAEPPAGVERAAPPLPA